MHCTVPLTEFDEPTVLLYHGTNAEYDEVDFDFLARGDSCANCALGLWLTPNKELASQFGSRVITFELPTDGIVVIGIGEMMKLHGLGQRDEDGGYVRHAEFAASLVEMGKTLLIQLEEDGTWGTAVALRPEVARIVAIDVPEDVAIPSP